MVLVLWLTLVGLVALAGWVWCLTVAWVFALLLSLGHRLRGHFSGQLYLSTRWSPQGFVPVGGGRRLITWGKCVRRRGGCFGSVAARASAQSPPGL